MATRIQLRRDTAAAWAEANPTLALGEAGFDSTNNQIRIGDGERNWSALTPLDGSNIDLSAYATKSSLSTESSTRANADAALQQQIDNLEGVDLSGYATTADLQAEADARTQADSSLQTQLNQGLTLINALDERVTALENGGGGGNPNPGAISLIYRGTSYWPTTIAQGDAYAHPDDATLFLPTLDLTGFDLAAFLDEFANAGTTFLITETADKNRWAHFEATGRPQKQTWGRNVPTTRIGGKFAIRDDREVSMVIDLAHAGTFDQSRWEGVEEMLAQMKRQITALKGEVTKLRKAQT